VVAIRVRKPGAIHERSSPAELDLQRGLIGDRWELSESPKRHSQVTLMNAAVARVIGHAERSGFDSGDNFYVDLDLSEDHLPAGTRLELGSAILTVTDKPHRGCIKFRARFGDDALRWVNLEELRAHRLRGIHCEVSKGGEVSEGDAIIVVPTSQLALGF
jgi:MOSC domain-containing protein YiiM